MIEQRQYKDWSLKFHNEHADEPIVIQMELTYRCPIHCVHCYADCYNNAESAGKELETADVKKLMDKLYDAGCLWFTFTGGDPMMRKDFTELYDYAKDRGFIFSVMTSLVGMTDRIFDKMMEKPPFSIDMTLNGVTEETYEKISRVQGSFKKVMQNIGRILKARLPLKIKTLVSKDNVHELEKIAAFLEERNLSFSPSSLIFARLNGDTEPCRHRLDVDEVIRMNFPDEDCEAVPEKQNNGDNPDIEIPPDPKRFYRCAMGNWQWHIDPYGKLNICSSVREPSYDLLTGDVKEGVKFLSNYVKNKTFSKDFECRYCKLWHICHYCPGKAKLEVGDEEKIIPYFCDLAKKEAKCIAQNPAS